ncbi:MAG: energy transducer TonB [Candidatus Kapaibacterium sp.]
MNIATIKLRREIPFLVAALLLGVSVGYAQSGSEPESKPVISLTLKLSAPPTSDIIVLPPAEVLGTRGIEYPENVREEGVQGTVRLKVLFDTKGVVQQTQVLEDGGDARLLNAAVEGLKKTTFQPGKIGGLPAEMWVIAEVRFTLERKVATPQEPMAAPDILYSKEEGMRNPDILVSPVEYDAVELATQLTYPALAKESNIEGEVMVSAEVNPDGRALHVRIVESTNNLFDEAVLKALHSIKFTPAVSNGIAIIGTIRLRFTFKLDGEGNPDMKVEEVKQEVKKVETYPTFVADAIPPRFSQPELLGNLVYPKEAEEKGIQGTVYVNAIIDNKGTVLKVTVVRSSHSIFNDAAVAAVLKTTFTPAIQNGYPIEMSLTIPINFKLAE